MATQTSIESYALVSGTQTQRVAEYLLQRTFDMRLTTDRDISIALQIAESTAAARRNDLVECKYFAHGVYWIPAQMPNRYDRVTSRKVQSWCMVVYTGEDMPTMKEKTVRFISKLLNNNL
jgi:hypothetical protein